MIDKTKKEFEKNQKKFDKKDNLRKEALKHRLAYEYYRLCDDLGIEPEDKYLYEQGKMERIRAL